MHFIQFAEKKDFWDCIKDLEQLYWYALSESHHSVPFFLILILFFYNTKYQLLLVTQGVGPSIAISFSVYEALRSFWQSER